MASFEEILVLTVGFTLPQADPKEFHVVGEFPAGMVTRVIAEDTVRSSPPSDEGLNGTEETFGA